MAVRTPTEIERLLDRIEKGVPAPDPEWRAQVAREIGKLFHVEADEVAVLHLSESGKSLKFVLPQKLQAVGSIPLSSTTALAARTARERRADAVNNFAASRHATVFEGVQLSERQNESIQKIMSVPILRGNEVVGVAQISRKGHSLGESGPDFSTKDLIELQSLNTVFGRFLSLHATL